MCVRSVVPNSLRPRGLWPTRLLQPWDVPGKDAGVGGRFLLRGIFPTQGLDLPLALAGGFFAPEPLGSPSLALGFHFQGHLKVASLSPNGLCSPAITLEFQLSQWDFMLQEGEWRGGSVMVRYALVSF